MIHSFEAARARRLAEPHFDVEFTAFHEAQLSVHILGLGVQEAVNSGVDMPHTFSKIISSDRLIFGGKEIDFFRYAFL